MSVAPDIHDVLLNFDPAKPQNRFKAAGLEAAFAPSEVSLPKAPAWPIGLAPQADPLTPAPTETDDLSRFAGYDAVVVTWTAVEASALAALFTPDHPTAQWYQYRHNVAAYIPLVTGERAPFRSTEPDMARYYHSLGLYMPCRIGNAKVLLVKSGLHLDYDGPAIPVRQLMLEIAQTVRPRFFITTGTGGAIGADVHLGDVVIAGTVRFDCKTQFKQEPFATAVYHTPQLPVGTKAALASAIDLTKLNASRIPGARPTPQFFCGAADAVVTTDFFAFDDSTHHYQLDIMNNRACDMGDAMVADAMQEAMTSVPGLRWYAIRNASDPEIQNPNGNMTEASEQAAQIYAKYGGLTTAASVIATWAVITSAEKTD